MRAASRGFLPAVHAANHGTSRRWASLRAASALVLGVHPRTTFISHGGCPPHIEAT